MAKVKRIKKTATEKLNDVLEIANDELADAGKAAVTVVTPKDVTKTLQTQSKASVETPENEMEEDASYARAKLYTLIDKASEGVDGILEVCQEGSHPRSYEVLGQLVKITGELTKDLLALHKLKAEINKFKFPGGEQPPAQIPESINPLDNAQNPTMVFQGTSLELLQAIKKAKEEPEDTGKKGDK
jgi:hypothetical protein